MRTQTLVIFLMIPNGRTNLSKPRIETSLPNLSPLRYRYVQVQSGPVRPARRRRRRGPPRTHVAVTELRRSLTSAILYVAKWSMSSSFVEFDD